MRVLCASVLAMEAIVVLLAGVMATSGDPGANLGPFLAGLALGLLIGLAAGTVTRPWGVRLGWALQALALGYGVLLGVTTNAVFGVTFVIVLALFVALWAGAVRTGRRIDGMRGGADPAT